MEKSDIMFRVSLVGTTFFDIYNRVKHLKRKLTLRKNGAFGFAFGVQHGLWQKQGLIKSKIKTNKKLGLREENLSAIILGLLFYDRHWPFLNFFILFSFRFVLGVQHGLWQKHPLIKREIKTSKKIRLREETIIAIMIGLLFYDRHWPFLSFFSLFYEGKSSTNAQT